MKLPEKTPKMDPANFKKLPLPKLQAIFSPSEELKELYKKANADYLYWDKFKQLNFPEAIKAEEAWFGLTMSRDSSMREILPEREGRKFKFFVTAKAQSFLSKIDQFAAGNISLGSYGDSTSLHLERNNEQYVINSLMEEGIASSQIEGAATTRKKAKEMLKSGDKPRNKDQQMILNNFLTIRKIRDEWKNRQLSEELIHEIHRSMAYKTMDDEAEEGRFRRAEDDVKVIDEEGKVLYTPPDASKIQPMIETLCRFANTDHEDEDFIHPVVKAIIIHFWLAYIHPYVDGNGRTARALFYWYMLSRKYWLFEFLSISRIILNARKQYEAAFLYTEYDGYDLNYFISHQLQSIHKAIEDLKAYLVKKQEELQQSTQLLRKNQNINQRQRSLLLHAMNNPDYTYTVKAHKNVSGTSYETARHDLLELVTLGLFEAHKKGKEFFFTAIPTLKEKLK